MYNFEAILLNQLSGSTPTTNRVDGGGGGGEGGGGGNGR